MGANFGQVSLRRRLLAWLAGLLLSSVCGAQGWVDTHLHLDQERRLRPEWLARINQFPDRFLLGSDAFLRVPREGRRRAGELLAPTLSIAEQLPEELARRVRYENAQRL